MVDISAILSYSVVLYQEWVQKWRIVVNTFTKFVLVQIATMITVVSMFHLLPVFFIGVKEIGFASLLVGYLVTCVITNESHVYRAIVYSVSAAVFAFFARIDVFAPLPIQLTYYPVVFLGGVSIVSAVLASRKLNLKILWVLLLLALGVSGVYAALLVGGISGVGALAACIAFLIILGDIGKTRALRTAPLAPPPA